MTAGLQGLLAVYREAAGKGEPLVLATILGTAGSTYRKAGAQMLIGADGRFHGLLSGGCLETDLVEHGREVLASGSARIVDYDLRQDDDSLFGLGLGCNGALRILLSRLDAESGYWPLPWLETSAPPAAYALLLAAQPDFAMGTVLAPDSPAWGRLPVGRQRLLAAALGECSAAVDTELDGWPLLLLPVRQAPRLLILGAGPDVPPLVQMAILLGWRCTVCDHRPAFATPERLPGADVRHLKYQRFPDALALETFDAVVVMSHHLDADAHYLRALAASQIPYVGLLGPAARRDRLLDRLGEAAAGLGSRLHAPVGLDLGGDTPESIALSIVAEIQAHFARRRVMPLREKAGPLHE